MAERIRADPEWVSAGTGSADIERLPALCGIPTSGRMRTDLRGERRRREPQPLLYRQKAMRKHRWIAALGVLLAACGSTTGDAFDVIGEGQSNGSYELGPSKFVDYLDGSGEGQPLVVEGTITSVEDGVGMMWTLDEQGENERRTILPFGDDSSMVESAHLVVDVDRFLAEPEDNPVTAGQVRFGITVDNADDVAALRSGLVDQSVVLFLRRDAVFDYEEDLFGVVLDGALLCRRGESQPLECPALDSGLATALELESVTDEMLAAP